MTPNIDGEPELELEPVSGIEAQRHVATMSEQTHQEEGDSFKSPAFA